MKKSRSTEEQIVGVLKESEAGLDTAEPCRKHGISQQTLYRWKAKYGGLEVSDAERLRWEGVGKRGSRWRGFSGSCRRGEGVRLLCD